MDGLTSHDQDPLRSDSISKGEQSVGWHIRYTDISFIFLSPAKIMALNSGTHLLTIDKRLPPEIMSEIFTIVTMRNLDDFGFKKNTSTPSPLSLTLVCRSWRSIAQSTPALWTSLRIYIPYRNIPQHIQDIQQWISRSGQLPLSIQVHRHPSALLESLDPLVDELINLVKSCSHRWESLEIKLDAELLLRFCDSISGPSILKTLILAPPRAYVKGFRKPFNTGAPLSSPIYVSLSSSTVWPLGICWDNVTHFTARRMDAGQALEILRLSPQLQEFTLSGLWRANDGDLPSSPVLRTRLETLHAYLTLHSVSHQIMENITSPSLKHLNCMGHQLSASSIINFLDRSGCSLETFSLRDAAINEGDIIHLLSAMPHLETLTLESRYITNRLLNMLTAMTGVSTRLLNSQTYAPFLPKLQSLKCIGRPIFSWFWLPIVFGRHGTNEPGASDGASESGISESGTFDRRPLRSFTLVQDIDSDSDDLDADIMVEVKRLREEGCVIDIVFGHVQSAKLIII